MSVRLLLAALPAVLAPVGGEGEFDGPDRPTVAEAPSSGNGWTANARPRSDKTRLSPSASELDGLPDRDAAELRHAAAVHEQFRFTPAGLASLGVTCGIHLTRCGHSADHLDIPPPPRG